jgi:hypothetical protein
MGKIPLMRNLCGMLDECVGCVLLLCCAWWLGAFRAFISHLLFCCTYRAGVKYSGRFVDTDPMVQRFWTGFETMHDKDRQDLLRFVTGTCRIPLDGFDPPFTLTPSRCWNVLL